MTKKRCVTSQAITVKHDVKISSMLVITNVLLNLTVCLTVSCTDCQLVTQCLYMIMAGDITPTMYLCSPSFTSCRFVSSRYQNSSTTATYTCGQSTTNRTRKSRKRQQQ